MTTKIRREQIALIIFFTPMVFKLSVLPSQLAKSTLTDAPLTIALLLITEFLHLILILAIVKFGGVAKMYKIIGKKLSFLILMPLLFVYIAKLVIFGEEAANYVSFFLFYNVKHWGVKAVLFMTAFYFATKGAKCFGRVAELCIYIIPFIFLFGLIFGKISATPEYALPILSNGLNPVLDGYQQYIFWAFDFSPLIFFEFDEKDIMLKIPGKKRRKIPYILISSITCCIVIVGIYFFFFMNYGGATPLIDHAFARLATFNVVSTQIGSIEWPSIILWLLTSMLLLAIKIFACGKTVELLDISPRIGAGGATLVALLLVYLLVKDLNTAIEYATSILRFITLAIEIIFPTVILIILVVNKKKEKKVEQA